MTLPAICAGTARDDERPPTRKPSSASARVGDDVRRALVARVGVNDAEAGGGAGDPGGVVAAELAEVVADGLEHPVALPVEVGDHHRRGGLVEIFLTRGADADADRADPLVETGRTLELGEHGRQPIADRIGDVDEAEPVCGERRPELRDAGLDGGFAARTPGVRVVESRHLRCPTPGVSHPRGVPPISANLCVMSAIRIVGLLAMRGGLADGRGLGCGVVVSARGLAGAGTGDRCLEGSAQGQVGRRPAAHAVAASGLRTLAARDRGPGQEGEPGRSVRRGLVEAAEEVGGLAARVVRRAVSRTGDRDVGRWRVPGQGVRRDDGEGAGQDRSAVAPALQRAPSVAGVRLLQAHGDRRTGYGRSVRAVSGRRGRLCARRPGLLDRCGPAPCGVRGRLCHRAREHRVAVASSARAARRSTCLRRSRR